MPPSKEVDFLFPLRGLDLNSATRRQPELTSPSLLNVRAYDAIGDRARGGQRDGLSDYLGSTVNGSNAIQDIDQLTRAFDPRVVIPKELLFSDSFTQSDGPVSTDTYYVHEAYRVDMEAGFSTTMVGDKGPGIVSNQLAASSITTKYHTLIFPKTLSYSGSYYVMKSDFFLESTSISEVIISVGFVFRATDPSSTLSSGQFITAGVYDSFGSDATAIIHYGPDFDDEVKATLTGFNHSISHTMELQVAGDYMRLLVDDVLQVETTQSVLSSNSTMGFMIGCKEEIADTTWMDNVEVYSGQQSATLRTTELMTVSGGNIYSIQGTDKTTVGSSALKTNGRVSSQAAFQKMYYCDGTNYKVYDPVTGTTSSWITTEGKGTLPQGGSSGQDSYTVASVTAGAAGSATIELTTGATDSSGDFSDGDIVEVRDTSLNGNNRSYTVSALGATYVNPTTTVNVDELIATSSTGGTLRIADKVCTMMCLYRGRVVLSGLETDPQNWFMSASGDPHDFDYFPTTINATQAVAGNASDAGMIGDVVTCLAPYSDDLLVLGGDHTIWAVQGDPASGGSITNVSYQTGISGPRAFAWSPEGTLYFVGSGALWKMGLDLAPQPISRGRVDSLFKAINLSTYEVHCLWDSLSHGIHIYLVPLSQPSTAPVHIYYDQRTDSFWKDQYPAAIGPTCVHMYDADDPDDKALLLGGWDSTVRFLDSDATDDDGTVINSYVMYPPLIFSDRRNVMLNHLRPIMATGSGAVRLEVHADETSEDVIASTTPVFSRTLTAGRNVPSILPVTGNAIALRFENDSSTALQWAVESVTGLVYDMGRQRKGRL